VVGGGPALLSSTRWADPKAVPSLATFACGGSTPYEVEVDDLVHDIHANGVIDVRVAEDAVGTLAGLCMVHPRPLGPFADAGYIAVIAVTAKYRGARVGDHLLHDALTMISSAVAGQMPLVWAMIAPGNQKSHDLFERHHFLDVAPAQTALNQSLYDWRIRAPGLSV
jgi:ribosomal protein S18 acetylase RimI-like enzyme